jgi:ribosomal protein L10
VQYEPAYRDQGNFVAWNLGPSFMDWWSGVQFPSAHKDLAWDQATRGRYVEFDNTENVQLHSDVAALAADSGRLGDSIVYLTNSGSGPRALLTAIKSKSNNIKAIVMYETAGAVFPDNAGIPPNEEDTGFGPFLVPVEEFKKLAQVPAVQFVWGDHRGATAREEPVGTRFNWTQQVEYSRITSRLINEYGGNSEVLMLREDAGLKGNTHIAFMDMNNEDVADLLEDFLKKNKLARYA